MRATRMVTWALLAGLIFGCHRFQVRSTVATNVGQKEKSDPADNKPQALAELEHLRQQMRATIFTEVGLVRHGESTAQIAFATANASESLELFDAGGAPSLPDSLAVLTPAGVNQAERLGAVLAESPPEVIVVSTVTRAQQTLFLALRSCGKPCRGIKIVIDSRARERSYGESEGYSIKGWARSYPAEIAREREIGRVWYRYPKGESMVDVLFRVGAMLLDINQRFSGRRVWFFCHSKVVLAGRYWLEGWGDLAQVEREEPKKISNASLTREVASGNVMVPEKLYFQPTG